MYFSANILSAGAIVGITIGCLILLAIGVGICAAVVFGCGKHRGSSGNVVTPNTGAPGMYPTIDNLMIKRASGHGRHTETQISIHFRAV